MYSYSSSVFDGIRRVTCRLATTDGTTSFALFPGLLPLFPLHRALSSPPRPPPGHHVPSLPHSLSKSIMTLEQRELHRMLAARQGTGNGNGNGKGTSVVSLDPPLGGSSSTAAPPPSSTDHSVYFS